jgi:hypothetical protein
LRNFRWGDTAAPDANGGVMIFRGPHLAGRFPGQADYDVAWRPTFGAADVPTQFFALGTAAATWRRESATVSGLISQLQMYELSPLRKAGLEKFRALPPSGAPAVRVVCEARVKWNVPALAKVFIANTKNI